MIPGKYNMVCPQGTTFSQNLIWSIDGDPVDLAGYSAEMHIREKINSNVITVDLNTTNGGIDLGTDDGSITVNISATETESIFPKDYVYDIELTSSGGEVYRLLEGKFIVTPGVTR